MSWVAAGVAAAGIAASLYSSNQASKDASGAANDAKAGLEGGVGRATELLSPYIESSEAANRQLMIELGMGGSLRGKDEESIAYLQEQIETLRNAPPPVVGTKKKKGGGLFGGAIGGLVGGLVGDPITGNILGTKYGEKGTPITGTYEEQIAALEAQLAKEQEAYGSASYEQTDNYMKAPGYQGAIEAGTQAVNQGAANSGALYSGARGEALKDVGQSVQQSYYNNYINMLSSMANPSSATNLANINIGAQGNIASQNINATNLNNANRSAVTADVFGGLTSAASAYMNQPTTTTAATTSASNTGAPINPVDYSGYV